MPEAAEFHREADSVLLGEAGETALRPGRTVRELARPHGLKYGLSRALIVPGFRLAETRQPSAGQPALPRTEILPRH